LALPEESLFLPACCFQFFRLGGSGQVAVGCDQKVGCVLN